MEAEQTKAQQWQRIDELFHSALAQAPVERTDFLAQACGEDESLRRKVEALLEGHARADSFFGTPALEVAAGVFAQQVIPSLEGRRLGHYEVQSLIGTGGMGHIFLADDTRLKRKVAVKVLPTTVTADPDRIRRFEQEALAASSLNHPNIITIHEVGQVEDAPFIVTEFIKGETLRRHMAAEEMRVNEALDVALQVASALEAAHTAGIVHRDIKPDNIMLRPDGVVKVLDFGLAKLTEARSSEPEAKTTEVARFQTKTGLVMGTVTYMSPEQARGLEVDARSDLFSLGTVIYEMIAGRVPFDGATTSDVIVSILEKEPAPLSPPEQGEQAELERIVKKALAKDRDQRYQFAKDLLIDLRNLKQEMELRTRLDAVSPVSSNGAAPAGLHVSVDTDEQLTTRSTDAEVTLTGSTPVDVVGKIKVHKRGVALGVAALLIAVAAVVYLTYFMRGEAIDSIAVLPLVNASNDADSEYLSDGISDNIINSLSLLPSIKRVIALNSVLHYKGKKIDPQAVGRELNVRAVLVGSLTRQGDDLLISVELIDLKDSSRLWGQQYSRKLANVFRLQGEIAQEISERLRLKLTGEQIERLAKSHTGDPGAIGLYMLGRHIRRNRGGNQKARDYLEQAIKKDPNYASAYAQLAYTYHGGQGSDWLVRKEARAKKERAAQRALELDETLGDGHAALALAAADWSVSNREFQRALELDPNSADVHAYYARALWGRRRIDEAIVHMKRAVELDPLSPALQADLGKIFYSAGQRDQAMEQYRKALDLDSNYFGTHHNLARLYLAEGRYEEAIAAAEKYAANARAEGSGRSFVGYIYAVAGKRAEAEKILHELKEESKQRRVNPQAFALIYIGLGDKNRAIEFLQKEYEENRRLHSFIDILPEWDSVRTDPRVRELIRKSESNPE